MPKNDQVAQADYPYIRAWGRMMGSSHYYIQQEVEKARQMQAPQDAIYERDGVWAVVDDIRSDETRRAIGAPPMTPERKAEFEYPLLRAIFERPSGMHLLDILAVQLHRKGIKADAFEKVYVQNKEHPKVKALNTAVLWSIVGRLHALEAGKYDTTMVRVALDLLSNIASDDDFRS